MNRDWKYLSWPKPKIISQIYTAWLHWGFVQKNKQESKVNQEFQLLKGSQAAMQSLHCPSISQYLSARAWLWADEHWGPFESSSQIYLWTVLGFVCHTIGTKKKKIENSCFALIQPTKYLLAKIHRFKKIYIQNKNIQLARCMKGFWNCKVALSLQLHSP